MPETRKLLAQEAYLALLRANDRWTGNFSALFKQRGLTLAQYNVLRILRGGDDAGLTCSTIGERLIHRLPDVTRLLDRMEQSGLVQRSRDAQDRRVVRVQLTAVGRDLVDSLDDPVVELHAQNSAKFTNGELAELERLLAKALE